MTKINGTFLAMDLENRFDRMAHPVSSLCAQRLGLPLKKIMNDKNPMQYETLCTNRI